MVSILILLTSNLFKTFVWVGISGLKKMFYGVLNRRLIAFFKYRLQVAAIGYGTFTASLFKLLQKQ